MIRIQHILVRVAQRKLVRDGRLAAAVGRSPAVRVLCRHRLEKLALCLWRSTCPRVSSSPHCLLSAAAPSTSKLFSGRRFPLDMLSSMGFHISSFSPSRLPGRSWPPGVRVEKPGARRALAIAEVLRRSQLP
jgi:hypothetical protein